MIEYDEHSPQPGSTQAYRLAGALFGYLTDALSLGEVVMRSGPTGTVVYQWQVNVPGMKKLFTVDREVTLIEIELTRSLDSLGIAIVDRWMTQYDEKQRQVEKQRRRAK